MFRLIYPGVSGLHYLWLNSYEIYFRCLDLQRLLTNEMSSVSGTVQVMTFQEGFVPQKFRLSIVGLNEIFLIKIWKSRDRNVCVKKTRVGFFQCNQMFYLFSIIFLLTNHILLVILNRKTVAINWLSTSLSPATMQTKFVSVIFIIIGPKEHCTAEEKTVKAT